jgi:hypothetical protein
MIRGGFTMMGLAIFALLVTDHTDGLLVAIFAALFGVTLLVIGMKEEANADRK